MKKRMVFIIIIILLVVLLLQSCNEIQEKMSMDGTSLPTYRFVCIYSGSSDDFKESLQEGISKAATDFNVWVTFHEFKPFEVDKHYEVIDKAIVAKVDGIITNVPMGDDINNLIETAYDNDIPVIMIESDLPESKRISFIGTNSYAFGVNASKLMIEAMGEIATTAIFKSSNANKFDLENQGFKHQMADIEGMDTELFIVNEPSIIEYINIAQSIFFNNPYIDSFFCHDTESTLGIVRAMIEFNKTNNTVIGSGDSNEILKYVKNGIVYASLVENPYSIGYLSIHNMFMVNKV